MSDPTFGRKGSDAPAVPLTVAAACLGFASGLPSVVLSDTMSAWLSDLGFSPSSVGLLTLAGLPYGLKFMWAPLLDRVPAPGLGFLGLRRSWVAFCSLLLVAGLVMLALAGPSSQAAGVGPALAVGIAVAFVSATLDAAIDAHRTDAASGGAEGPSAGAYVLGFRIASVSVGALALILHRKIALLLGPEGDAEAQALAWRWCVAGGGLGMVVGVAAALLAPEPRSHGTPGSMRAAVIDPLRSFVARFGPRMAAVAFVALTYRLPDLLGNRMTMPFLRQEMGFTLEDIGWVRQGLGFGTTIACALAGGFLVQRMGLLRALLAFGALQVASNAGYLVLVATGASMPVFVGVIVVENACNGLVSAAFVAYFMSLCEPRMAAAQYAMLSGLMYLSGAMVGATSGLLVEHLGYPGFFLVSIAVGIPPLLVLRSAMPPGTPARAPASP